MRTDSLSQLKDLRVYWYAPFDNALETQLAAGVAPLVGQLTVQSCSHRFACPLPISSDFRHVRNLPPPAGELGEKRTKFRRLTVALQRARLRHKQVTEGSFDIAHLHTYNPITDWIAIRQLRSVVPIIVQSVHDVRPHTRRMPRWLETSVLRAGYRRCNILTVADESLRQQLVSEFGLDPDRVVVVELPVRPTPVSSSQGPLSKATFSVLFFGTFRANKGIPVLLEAIRLLGGERRLRFTFAGRGDSDLEHMVESAASEDSRISVEVGYVSEARRRELLGDCDVIVLPYTRFNSQSGVLTGDAYGAGRPVIASAIGAIGTEVERSQSGWLVPPGDKAALASAIRLASVSELEYFRCVENIAIVRANRSTERVSARIVDLYSELVADPSPRSAK